MVTGLDLVRWQIRIARGERLDLDPDALLRPKGHAIECRIYAEDPDNNFFPSPGEIASWRAPAGPGVRMDEGVYAGWIVPGDYDPMLGKLIAWGADRAEAVARLRGALQEFYVTGIRTNTRLFLNILQDPEFLRGDIHTRWLDERLGSLLQAVESRAEIPPSGDISAADVAAIAAVLWQLGRGGSKESGESSRAAAPSPWKLDGRREQLARDPRR